ncbi:MAG: leucine-rich repeat domain-containing protein [Treponema sp.]|nr:leucine-rich repeat domain-containing protein [Treponema sp.]
MVKKILLLIMWCVATNLCFGEGEPIFGDFKYAERSGGIIISDYIGKGPDVVVPEQINGKDVVFVGYFFLNENNYEHSVPEIHSVKFPKTLKSVSSGLLTHMKDGLGADALGVKVEIDKENPYLEIVDGGIYDKNGTLWSAIKYEYKQENYESKRVFRVKEGTKIIKNEAINLGELEELYLPSSLEKLSAMAFYRSPEMKNKNSLNVYIANNEKYRIENNIVYDKDNKLLCYLGRNKENVKIPEGTISIEASAFHDSDIKSIYIPDTVKNIGLEAFFNSTDLQKVRMSKNIKNIYDWAFGYCEKLNYIAIKKDCFVAADAVPCNERFSKNVLFCFSLCFIPFALLIIFFLVLLWKRDTVRSDEANIPKEKYMRFTIIRYLSASLSLILLLFIILSIKKFQWLIVFSTVLLITSIIIPCIPSTIKKHSVSKMSFVITLISVYAHLITYYILLAIYTSNYIS